MKNILVYLAFAIIVASMSSCDPAHNRGKAVMPSHGLVHVEITKPFANYAYIPGYVAGMNTEYIFFISDSAKNDPFAYAIFNSTCQGKAVGFWISQDSLCSKRPISIDFLRDSSLSAVSVIAPTGSKPPVAVSPSVPAPKTASNTAKKDTGPKKQVVDSTRAFLNDTTDLKYVSIESAKIPGKSIKFRSNIVDLSPKIADNDTVRHVKLSRMFQ